MRNLIDLTGKKFGRLTVLYQDKSYRGRNAKWICKCECGNLGSYMSWCLRKGTVKSCGCLHSEIIKKVKTKYAINSKRIYNIWRTLKSRCLNPNSKDYIYYGDRGIKICAEWINKYEDFEKWALENGYSDNLTIDRINNDEGYSPENCRWTTMSEQNKNKRKNYNKTKKEKSNGR